MVQTCLICSGLLQHNCIYWLEALPTYNHQDYNRCYYLHVSGVATILLLVIVASMALTDAWMTSRSVCGHRTYDSSCYMCCGGRVVSKPFNPACCGTSAYDSHWKICCGGRIQNKPFNPACCGTQAFDSHWKICCGGRIQNKLFNPACCGTHAYDSHWKRCCNGRLC